MPSESMDSWQGMKMLALETSWSVTVGMVSKPCDGGSLVIKSTAMVWKGKSLVGVIGNKGGFVGCVLTLFIWQVAQPLM